MFQIRNLGVTEIGHGGGHSAGLFHADHRFHAGDEQLLLVVIDRVGIAAFVPFVVDQNGVDVFVHFFLRHEGVGQAQLAVVAGDVAVIVAGNGNLHGKVERRQVGDELTRFCIRADGHHIAFRTEFHLAFLHVFRAVAFVFHLAGNQMFLGLRNRFLRFV